MIVLHAAPPTPKAVPVSPKNFKAENIGETPEVGDKSFVGDDERAAYRTYIRNYMRAYRARRKQESS